MKLTNEEVEKYLKDVVDEKVALAGLEVVIFSKLQAAEKKIQALQHQAQQAQQVLARSREETSATMGEARSYVDLLVEAEAGRRAAAASMPMKTALEVVPPAADGEQR